MVQEIAVIAFGCRHGPMWTGAREKFKRKVFHLAGFDPRGARFYHQMYREQAEPNRSAARRSAREQAEADVRRCWGVTDGWKGDPLKGCNVFLPAQEPSPPVRTGLLPAQEHDSVCGKGGELTGGFRAVCESRAPQMVHCRPLLETLPALLLAQSLPKRESQLRVVCTLPHQGLKDYQVPSSLEMTHTRCVSMTDRPSPSMGRN